MLIAAGEGNDPAAEYLEAAARSMLRGGLMSCSWKLAQEGLRYIGERRDIVWASLDEIDTYRVDAENPDNPGIIVDSPRLRERRRILKNISSIEAKARRIDEYPYDSRQEIIQDPHCDNVALVFLAGDSRRSLPLWQERAAEAERSGRIALTMESWAFVARCHLGLGELDAVLGGEYTLGFTSDAAAADPRNVYDLQDEFYLPLAGFERIELPGPNLRVYVRRVRTE